MSARCLLLGAALSLLVGLATGGRCVGTNLLPNGGFEVGRFGWFLHTQFGVGERLENCGSGRRPGTGCLKLTRPAELGNTWLTHEFIELKADADYTFSVWLRADSEGLPVTLGIYSFVAGTSGRPQEVKQDFTVGKQWQRYELAFHAAPAVMDCYAPRIYVKGRGSLWIADVQVEEGSASSYVPYTEAQLGLDCPKTAGVFEEGEPPQLAALVANCGDQARRFTLTCRVMDFDDAEVQQFSHELRVAPGKTASEALDFGRLPLGYYRAEVGLLDEASQEVAQARWACAVVPRPVRPGDPRLGVCLERENIETDVPLAAELGFGSVRLHNALLWGNTEKQQGVFDWSLDEPMLRAVAKAGLEGLAIPDTCPAWAWDAAAGAPRDTADWARMIETTVARWKGVVHSWEIINEPVAHFSPEVYLKLLQAACLAARRADPDCTVVGICGFDGDEKLMPYILDEGGLDSLDVLSMHPYACFGKTPEVGMPPIWAHARALLAAHGADKPLWSTEFGWRATDWPARPDHEGAATDVPDEKTQAQWAVRSIVLSRASGVERFYYFMFATHLYSGPYTASVFAGDSLASPKKIVSALAELNRELAGLDFIEALDLGSDNGCGYRFAAGKTQRLVLWAPEAPSVAYFRTSADAPKLRDICGRPVPVRREGALLRVEISPSPCYLEVPASATLEPVRLVALQGPAVLDPAEGGELQFDVVVANLLPTPLTGRLEVTPPTGWQADGSLLPVDLASGKHETFRLTLTAPERTSEALASLTVRLLRRGGALEACAVHRLTVKVGPPPKPPHTIWLEAEDASPRDPLFNVLSAEGAYGGRILQVESSMAPADPPGWLVADYPFEVAEEGDYLLRLLGNPLNVTWMSPFKWRVDEGGWSKAWDLPQQGELWTPWPDKGKQYRYFGRTDLGHVRLEPGPHVLHVRLDERRQADTCYTALWDAFVLLKDRADGGP